MSKDKLRAYNTIEDNSLTLRDKAVYNNCSVLNNTKNADTLNAKYANSTMRKNEHALDCELTDNASSAFFIKKANVSQNGQTRNPVKLSFQIMTRAEPIAVVIATIKSLLAVKSDGDEILIIDNNHTDKALYEPLAAYCKALDDRHKVRFHHVDKVANFKSGALNLALAMMDARCSHIVVVDSDYQALPHARTAIIEAIGRHPTHALLQFPQFYRDQALIDVHSELNHYFNYHIYRSFNRTRALSTGTFAVIRRQALLSLGGWSGASITEDAQMGVLMHQQGLRSQFIPKVIATGLLPMTLSDLINQRQRWVYGNMQVLSTYFSIATNKPLTDQQKLPLLERLAYVRAHFSQLSAWVNFTGAFILLHSIMLIIIASAMLFSFSMELLLAPLYAVYASYALFMARRLWAYSQDTAPLNKLGAKMGTQNMPHATNISSSYSQRLLQKLRAWLLHMNFWELGALSWLPVLWGRDKPFVCTPKQEVNRTKRSTFIANIKALPKLLLLLNVGTAIIVAPFSPLHTPLLFIFALIVCTVKLGAAGVAFQNYRYHSADAQIIRFKDITIKKVKPKPVDNMIILSKNSTLSKHSSLQEHSKTVNNLVDSEAVNS